MVAAGEVSVQPRPNVNQGTTPAAAIASPSGKKRRKGSRRTLSSRVVALGATGISGRADEDMQDAGYKMHAAPDGRFGPPPVARQAKWVASCIELFHDDSIR